MRVITLPLTSTFDGSERAVAPFPSKMRTFSKRTSSALAVAQSPSTRAATSNCFPEGRIMKAARSKIEHSCGVGRGMRHLISNNSCSKKDLRRTAIVRTREGSGHHAGKSHFYDMSVKTRSTTGVFRAEARVGSQADLCVGKRTSAKHRFRTERHPGFLKPLSSLIPPDYLSHRPDLGQAAELDWLPFCGGRAFEACAYPLGFLASFAAHPNGICRNVAEKPLQISWRIPALHTAMDASNANQLTGIMGFGERPRARALFSTIFRHRETK